MDYQMQGIPDSLAEGLLILFVGYNPSLRSGVLGHNYAGRGNRFWKLLHESGLTEKLLEPSNDRDLLAQGYGFTNIVDRPTRRADEITRQEYAAGRVKLREKLATYRPRIVCYVGKGVYEQFTGHRYIPWGVQPQDTVQGTIDFVAPSSSGLVRMPFEDIRHIYEELKKLADTLRKG
ncbi:MAG TPA: mismatch-specific DNA-glycosylase [Bacilli bacterium]|nr:mismatch-specific DNA-glycosylase [Bacilli bacterium]